MKHCFSFILLFSIFSLSSQNLVPDPSFDDFYSNVSACGAIDTGITTTNRTSFFRSPKVLRHWSSPTFGISGIADSLCGTVPRNYWDYQIPKDGSGYALLRLYHHSEGFNPPQSIFSNSRSYLQTELSQTLEKNKYYRVSFYVSPSIYIPGNDANFYATSTIGAHLSAIRITDFPTPIREDSNVLYVNPQIENDTNRFFDDTTKWYQVCGIIKATGGEKWLTIGNFKGNRDTKLGSILKARNGPYTLYENASCFIDFVSVEEVQNIQIGNTRLDTTFCPNQPFSQVLRARQGANTYLWNDSTTADTLVIDTFGTYWLQANYGCGLEVDTFKVLPKDLLTLKLASDTTVCETLDSIQLTVNLAFEHYKWSNGNTTPSIWVKQSGVYSVEAAYLCDTLVDSIRVTFNPQPPPPVVADTGFCLDDTVQLSAQGQNLLWYDSLADPNPKNNPPTLFNNSIAEREFWVSQSLNNCESDLANFSVKTEAATSINLGVDTILCGVDSLQIGQTPSTTWSYRWNNGASNSSIWAKNSGKYWLQASNYCNTSSDTIVVSFNPIPPPPQVQNVSYCDTIMLNEDSLKVQGQNLLWYESETDQSAKIVAPIPQNLEAGDYEFLVSQTINSCESKKATFQLRIIEQPFNTLITDSIFCFGTSVTIGKSQLFTSYLWNTGDTLAQIMADSSGIYSLLASNVCGFSHDSVSLIFEDCETEIFIPNVFSPNGDGINDFFFPQGVNFNIKSIKIYNRWGQEIFITVDPWDGNVNGKKASLGNYYVVMSYFDSKGELNFYNGSLMLVR
mgnify:CR=1 FL=1